MASRPYNEAGYKAYKRHLRLNNIPCRYGCGRRATTPDHVPALMHHAHIPGSGCCDLHPACHPCNSSHGAREGNAIRNPSSGWLDSAIVRPAAARGGLTTDPHVVVGHPRWATRNVTLICGPPGSGKSTLARTLHTAVIEVEPFEIPGNRRETLRRYGLAVHRVGRNALANVAVVRGAPKQSEQQHHEAMCHPARTIVLTTPADVCLERLTQRDGPQPWHQLAVSTWWSSWSDAVDSPSSGWI